MKQNSQQRATAKKIKKWIQTTFLSRKSYSDNQANEPQKFVC